MPRSAPTLALALLLALVPCPPIQAQDWRGQGRAHGVVLDADGEPLAQARVALRVAGEDADSGGPPAATTGRDGTWSIPLLAPGLYEIRIEAPAHLPAEGWVRVPASGVAEPVRVEMQSLDLVTPAFAEGDPAGSVRRWLEVGDALLADGRPAEARAEYLKALGTPGVLEPAARAELLSTIARSHFLDRDAAAAERALRAALVVAPDGSAEADRVRRLYTVLLEDTGRGEEAEAFFTRLRGDRSTAREEVADLLAPRERPAPDPAAAPPERPVTAPEPGRPGRYRTSLAQPGAGSPLASPEVYLERHGLDRAATEPPEPADQGGLGYSLAEETFEVYVPAGYRPDAGYGLLVWISPTPFGGIETPEAQEALDRARLIWVGANRSGNRRSTRERVGLALDAAHAVAALYDLAPERVYAAGYSGGGRVASGLALLYPEVFRGALSVYGVSWFEPVPVSDKPGAHWPAAFPPPPAETLRGVRADSRFVLLTGSRDFNKPQTRAVHRAMTEAGFEHVTYLEVPGASHYELPDGEWWKRALRALE